MEKFIKKLLDSRPHQNLMEYQVEWNDGSIGWVSEKVVKDYEDYCPICGLRFTFVDLGVKGQFKKCSNLGCEGHDIKVRCFF